MIEIILGVGAGLFLMAYGYSQYQKKQFKKRHEKALDNLSYYVENMNEYGIQKANEWYPEVPVHLLECSICNENFSILQGMKDDPQLDLEYWRNKDN
jgi:hypothetical protein